MFEEYNFTEWSFSQHVTGPVNIDHVSANDTELYLH